MLTGICNHKIVILSLLNSEGHDICRDLYSIFQRMTSYERSVYLLPYITNTIFQLLYNQQFMHHVVRIDFPTDFAQYPNT